MKKTGLDSEVFNKPTNKVIIEDSDFPLEVFPQTVQDIIIDLHKAQGIPVDFIAGSMLFAVSTAIGNTHIAYLKRDIVSRATIYMALVGRKGTGKSYPLEWILRPIKHRDRESYKIYLQDYKSFRDGEIMEAPVQSRFLVNDVTKERLNQIHSQNPRGLGLVSDELLNFYYNINRYHKGNDLQYYLSNWSNIRIQTDRIKDDMPQNDYDQFVSIAGTIQPELVNEFLKGKNNFNGWFDRWLFAYPKIQKFSRFSTVDLKDETSNNWKVILNKILDIPFVVDSEPKILRYNKQAFETYFDWYETNADIVDEKQDPMLSGLQAKYTHNAQRLTLILEVMDWACNDGSGEIIRGDTSERGIKLAEYYREISLNIAKDYQSKFENMESQKNKELFIDSLPDKFSFPDAEKVADDIGVKRRQIFNYLKDSRIKKLEHNTYQKVFENGIRA